MGGAPVVAGALTGLVVGMTGVGGGALMTPILLLVFDSVPLTAVGTDLWFATITKLAVSGLHLRQRLIDWPVARRLWCGSLPASALTLLLMAYFPADGGSRSMVRLAIAVAVGVTAVSLLARPLRPAGRGERTPEVAMSAHWEAGATVAAGAVLGALVTLTSVGAGALGAVALVRLYPERLTPSRLVATDIAHAIPLAICAGAGHLAISQVDGGLLAGLLAGSIPAALLGARLSVRVPGALLRRLLGVVLLLISMAMLGSGR